MYYLIVFLLFVMEEWRVEPVGQHGLNVLCILHFIITLGWTVGVSVFQNRVAWFMSGMLAPTHMILMLLLMTRIYRTLFVRLAYRIVRTANLKILPAHLRPAVWPRESIVGLIILSVTGLPLLGCYMASMLFAKYYPASPADWTIKILTSAMWNEEPATPIIVLCMVSATVVLHLVDFIIGCVMYAHDNQRLKFQDASELIDLKDDNDEDDA